MSICVMLLICIMLQYVDTLKGVLKLEFYSRLSARHIAKHNVKQASVFVC